VLEERKSDCAYCASRNYGPGSEKLSDLQPALLEQESAISNVEVQAENQRARRSKRFARSVGKKPSLLVKD
jgi:hypothetical protein